MSDLPGCGELLRVMAGRYDREGTTTPTTTASTHGKARQRERETQLHD